MSFLLENSKVIEINLNDDCFNYSIKFTDKVDWSKLQYNNLYKSYEYYDSRFSGQYSHIPGFDIIIDNMTKQSLTPYEEMQQRISDSLLYNNDN